MLKKIKEHYLKMSMMYLNTYQQNVKVTFEIFKNELERLYHFFVDKMWGDKEK